LFKRIFFIGMFVFLFLVVVSVSSAISGKNHYENEKPAIVFATATEVKSEPQKAGNTAFILHEGTKVFVLEALDNWKKIQLTDGTQGWIDKNAIREVK